MTSLKKSLTGIAMMIGLVAVALVLRNRRDLPDTPAAAVSALIEAAGNADAEAYLSLTGGQLRRSLEQSRNEMGADAFRAYLRRWAEGIKSSAVPIIGDPQGNAVTVDVEYVFIDRDEHQRTEFVRRGNGWVITSMEKTTFVKPSVAYGTPVFDEPPVQGDTGSSENKETASRGGGG